MHMIIHRDDVAVWDLPDCPACDGDGLRFHGTGEGGGSSGLPLDRPSGGWSECHACAGTGIAPSPRRKWRDEVAGTLGCLGFVALFVVIYVMLP